jgi:hypothetical protein
VLASRRLARGPGHVAVALLMAATVMAAATPAQAQQAVLATNGSPLQVPANLELPGGANQCLARPYIGLGAGSITFINTGQTSCMWWSTQYGPDGAIVANTYVPRGAGAVTRVRIRSGTSPAPLQFAIVSSGGGLCCTTNQVSTPVQPAPNQVSEFAVNLPAGSGVGTTAGSQFNDIVVVVAVGPGSLPVNDRGAHGFLFGSPANQAQASFLHPALALGASSTDVGIMDGYEVLLQYDWCGAPMTRANPQPVAPPDPQIACTAQGPPPAPGVAPPATAPGASAPATAPPSPLRALAALAAVRRNVAALPLRCLLDTTCAGTLQLRPRTAGTARAAKATSYGSARFRIGAHKAATLKVKLSNAGRSALRRKRRLPVDAVVSARGTSWTLKLTLKS